MNRREAILGAAAAILGSQLPVVAAPYATYGTFQHLYEVTHYTESGKRITFSVPREKIKEISTWHTVEYEVEGRTVVERITFTFFECP
jgi:hypothetical protein